MNRNKNTSVLSRKTFEEFGQNILSQLSFLDGLVELVNNGARDGKLGDDFYICRDCYDKGILKTIDIGYWLICEECRKENKY
jgi:hypothetical protein